MESSVKTISRPVIDRLPVGVNQLACRQLDRVRDRHYSILVLPLTNNRIHHSLTNIAVRPKQTPRACKLMSETKVGSETEKSRPSMIHGLQA